MDLTRPPGPRLRPFVALLWASDGSARGPAVFDRELVLPTGLVHIAVRLGDRPLRLFRDGGAAGEVVGCAVVGGARAGPYLKDISQPAASVGAVLRPGAAAHLVGAPAGAFSGRHVRLDDLWPPGAVEEFAERLEAAPSLAARIGLLEQALVARLRDAPGIDPLVAHALARLGPGVRIDAVARGCGVSPRHLTRIFTAAAGLAPKTYQRLQRFSRVLDRLACEPAIPWAELAAAEGYADQAHFAREFRALAGLAPGRYRRAAPAAPRHVPVRFVQDTPMPPG